MGKNHPSKNLNTPVLPLPLELLSKHPLFGKKLNTLCFDAAREMWLNKHKRELINFNRGGIWLLRKSGNRYYHIRDLSGEVSSEYRSARTLEDDVYSEAFWGLGEKNLDPSSAEKLYNSLVLAGEPLEEFLLAAYVTARCHAQGSVTFSPLVVRTLEEFVSIDLPFLRSVIRITEVKQK